MAPTWGDHLEEVYTLTLLCPWSKGAQCVAMAGKDGWINRALKREESREGGMVDLDFVLDGDVISHVGIRERKILIFGSWIVVGSIGGVATEEPYRNRGLATRLMERAVERIEEDGGDLMLVSGDRGLYRRLGCLPGGVFYRLELDRDEAADVADPHNDTYRIEDGDFFHISRLQHAEPVRWQRDMADLRSGLEGTAAPLWRSVDPWLVERRGQVMPRKRMRTGRGVFS